MIKSVCLLLVKINIDLIKTFPTLLAFYFINSINFNAEFPTLMFTQILSIKGQLISKENFSVFNSPKNELENVNFCPSLLGQKCFINFLGELKKPKYSFEIN